MELGSLLHADVRARLAYWWWPWAKTVSRGPATRSVAERWRRRRGERAGAMSA